MLCCVCYVFDYVGRIASYDDTISCMQFDEEINQSVLNITNNMCADESDSNMDRLTVIVHHSLATIISGQMKRQTLKTPIVKLKKLSIHQSVQTQ